MVAQTHLSVMLYTNCLSCLAYTRLGVYIIMIASWSSSSVYSWMGGFSALAQLFLIRLNSFYLTIFHCFNLWIYFGLFLLHPVLCLVHFPPPPFPHCFLFGLFLVWQRLLRLPSILNRAHSKVHIVYSLGLMAWRLTQSGSRVEWKGKEKEAGGMRPTTECIVSQW